MKVVVGLGNPGKKYDGSPHNVGFAVIDRLCEMTSSGLRRSLRFKARMGDVSLAGERVLLVKPQTYMNRSGDTVGAILRYRKLSTDDLIVVLDDADLAFCRLRIRGEGSSGGHRGLESIIAAVGSVNFARIKIGIGRGMGKGSGLIEHVLRPFGKDEAETVKSCIDRAASAVETVLESSISEAMNRFNGPEPVESVQID